MKHCEDIELTTDSEYLNKWFSKRALQEILYYKSLISEYHYVPLLRTILSRAARSSRLIPHYDLATPKEPVYSDYFCYKHHRICSPIQESLKFINRYSYDTLKRVKEFDKLRTPAWMEIVQGDARDIDLNPYLGRKKVDGIFTSPPYVGQIDYHEQHIYAYELFGFKRNDEKEIGPKKFGKSEDAQEKYIQGISESLLNMKKFLKKKAIIFIVANDKFKLYPEIAKRSGLVIKDIFHRAVSKRTERDRHPYSESIFSMKITK